MDEPRDGNPLRCPAQHDLPTQGHPTKPPFLDGGTCEARHVRRVRLDIHIFLLAYLESLCSDDRATGVAFTLNPLLHPDGPKDTRTVRGAKLVVVSAGAFGSPGILERSGIGAKDVLERVGVKQRVDLPGVGENYQGIPEQRALLMLSFF